MMTDSTPASMRVRLWIARHRMTLRFAAALSSFVWLPAVTR